MSSTSKYNTRNKETLVCLLVLLSGCLIAYYPLTFHLFSLKNDALNYFLPVRYQISESISNGIPPLWSPYFNLGYPLHADMQSGVWNPFVQLFSIFGSYTLKSLQYETLLYVFISGVSMFFLIDYLLRNKHIALLIGMGYMLSGFNSDSAQFLNWISAASFLPFVFLFYLRTIKEKSWKQALFFAFSLYLLFTTAYPADFIITCYILLFYFIYFIWQSRNDWNRLIFFQFVRLHLLIACLFIALALPAIISFYEFLPLSERGGGASFQDAMSNPYHPLLFFSYVCPLGFWKAYTVGITDPLERSSFFGIISFTFFIGSIFIRAQNPLILFTKWACLATFLFSLGPLGIIRPLTYHVFPLMNAFRHPANARIFTIFFACILSAFAITQASGWGKKFRLIIYWTIPILIMSTFIYSVTVSPLMSNKIESFSSISGIKTMLDNASFADLTLLNLFIQIPFLITLYFFFVKHFSLKWLLITGIFNSIIHTALVQPFTVVKKDTVNSIQSVLNKVQAKGYPLPDLNHSILENSNEGNAYFNEIGAANMYNKKVGRIDYRITPSNLNGQNNFWFNEPLRNTVLNYPLVYKADTAFHINNANKKITGNKKAVFLNNSDLIKSINEQIPGTAEIKITKFNPGLFQFEIKSATPGFYTLIQNWYPRWQLIIDNKSQSIIKSNEAFMGFSLPSGNHTISFSYKKQDLRFAFYISLFSTIFIIGLGLINIIRSSYPS